MKKIIVLLTKYVIKKGMVSEEDKEIYEYGFMVALEMGISVLACLSIMFLMKMFVEGILFFIIFIPLRAYAGGLHMSKFIYCFLLSCLTFFVVLISVKYFLLPSYVSIAIIFAMVCCVYYLYPVENQNRIVDKDENRYFKRKLKKVLSLDICIAIICSITREKTYLMLIAATFFMVVITMYLGKWKAKINNYENISNGISDSML